jgi:hypothetical protein
LVENFYGRVTTKVKKLEARVKLFVGLVNNNEGALLIG